jgi:hypothetical protein
MLCNSSFLREPLILVQNLSLIPCTPTHSSLLNIVWIQSFTWNENMGLCKYKVQWLIRINI